MGILGFLINGYTFTGLVILFITSLFGVYKKYNVAIVLLSPILIVVFFLHGWNYLDYSSDSSLHGKRLILKEDLVIVSNLKSTHNFINQKIVDNYEYLIESSVWMKQVLSRDSSKELKLTLITDDKVFYFDKYLTYGRAGIFSSTQEAIVLFDDNGYKYIVDKDVKYELLD